MNNSKDEALTESEQMLKLRQLVLGKDNRLILDVVKNEARDLVTHVLTEALHDRQKSDGSVSTVLAPLVEKSVEASVVARKEQFVSYLYPLVGSLVRKSVSSFLAEIIEQTNEMLESSLTYKGLRWRFEARRAGISYSQYVVQQTFVFRVEQVLLIHRETGLLLKTVVRDKTQAADGDMFSAMLTAINDFVSDSFFQKEGDDEQNLDEIKTDDFTLLIKQGPKAVLVAAITGNPPSNIADKLQLTLENIHQIYNNELNLFEGDASDFENTEQQLNDCLLAQQKEEKTTKKKVPWLAIIPLLLTVVFLGYFAAKHWYLGYVAEKIQTMHDVPGIVLLEAVSCEGKVCIDILRDPLAQEALTWIAEAGSYQDLVQVHERAYRSLDPKLLPQRLFLLQKDFPTLSFDSAKMAFHGSISSEKFEQLKIRLEMMPESPSVEALLSGVSVLNQTLQDDLLNTRLFEQKISDIKMTTLRFDVNASELPVSASETVQVLGAQIVQATEFAHKLKQRFLLVIMGASTSSGSDAYNQKLSLERAEAVKKALISQGVDPDVLRVAGLGVLSSNDDARRVIFEVIKLRPDDTEKVQE